MEAMYPDLTCPTLDDLTTVFSSKEYVELAKPFGLNNPNNFSADQVGAVLRLWGLHNSLSLRLGYVVRGEAFLLPQDGDANIVWIHNDNGEASRGIGHWSGMMPKLVASGSADQWYLPTQDSSAPVVSDSFLASVLDFALDSAETHEMAVGEPDQLPWECFPDLPALTEDSPTPTLQEVLPDLPPFTQDSSTPPLSGTPQVGSENHEPVTDLAQPLWKLFASLPPLVQFMIHTVVFDLGKLYPWPHQHGEHFKPEDTTGALYQCPNMAWMAAIALMDKQLYEESLTKEQLEKKPFLKNSGKWRSRESKEEAERALYGRNIITMNEADHASFLVIMQATEAAISTTDIHLGHVTGISDPFRSV